MTRIYIAIEELERGKANMRHAMKCLNDMEVKTPEIESTILNLHKARKQLTMTIHGLEMLVEPAELNPLQ